MMRENLEREPKLLTKSLLKNPPNGCNDKGNPMEKISLDSKKNHLMVQSNDA